MKKILITALIVIVLGLAAYFSKSYWMPNIAPSQEVSTDGNSSYLVDDEIVNLTGCSDSSFLSQFSGYKLVYKINEDFPENYDIYVYDMSLDTSKLPIIRNKLGQKQKEDYDYIQKIEERVSEFKGTEDEGYRYGPSDLQIDMYSTQIPKDLEKYYREVDKVIWVGECESEPMPDGWLYQFRPNQNIIDQATVSFEQLLTGNIDINTRYVLERRERTDSPYDFTFVREPYKKGFMGIEADAYGGAGVGINLFYEQAIGDSIYRFYTAPIVYTDELLHPQKLYTGNNESLAIKTFDCESSSSCLWIAKDFFANLYKGKDTLSGYTEVYNKFSKHINYIFE